MLVTVSPVSSATTQQEKDDALSDYYDAKSARDLAHGNLLAAADDAKAANTAANNNKYSRTAAMNNEINAAKKENEKTRKETDKEADQEYKNAENDTAKKMTVVQL